MDKRVSRFFLKNEIDFILKVAFVGNANTGKTSLFKLLCDNNGGVSSVNFGEIGPTIGVDFGSISYEYKNLKFKLQFWDTAGHEKFKTITRSYYRNVFCVILVFDINNIKSFFDLNYWILDVKRTNQKSKIILIGNKNDLGIRVEQSEIDNFIEKYEIDEYFELSVKKSSFNKLDNLNFINESILDMFIKSDKNNQNGIKVCEKNHDVAIKTKKCCF